MKWTMISVAVMGLATYGVIFLAQLQNDAGPEPVAAESAALVNVEPGPATFEAVAVSEPAKDETLATPDWTGDPWQVGVKAFEQRDDELAVKALRAAVAQKEQSGYRHYVYALALRRSGDVHAATVELERSLELSPAAAKTWIALARCEIDRGEMGAARDAVDHALELDLESADAWHLLGRVELGDGSPEHAEAAFAKALERNPEHAWASNNLGYARILQERFAEAVSPLQDAVASGQPEAVFFNNLGIALERTGHEQLAALSFAHAVVMGHGPAESSMARVEARLGASGQAFAAVDSVEFVGPGELAARIEDAVLLIAAEVAGEDLVEPGLVVANEEPGSR